MVDMPVPAHVAIPRRDGRVAVILHRSMALIGDDKIEIKAARGTVVLPIIGLATVAIGAALLARGGAVLPFWALALVLLYSLFAFPISVMSLVGAIAGADVIVDRKKNSATWQQGYLGMGIGTRELVPFHKIDYLEVTVEGDEPVRWRENTDDLRQFALWLVKQSGKRLKMSQVPVAVGDQFDGMDRTLALAQSVAALTGAEIRLPEGWELVQINTDTGEPVEAKGQPPAKRSRSRKAS
jgi:hypothetical protein